MTDTEDAGVSPIGYLKIFFRRKELIIIPVFVGLIFGVCTGILLPKKYKSSTVIFVQEAKSDNPLFESLAVSSTVEQRLAGIKETILGWDNLVELVKRLNLDSEVETKLEFEKLIEGLRENILIKLRGTNILKLEYVGSDPKTTQAVVQNISDLFIGRNVQMQNAETSDAIDFIQSQLRLYQGKIKSAEIAQMQDQLNNLLIDSTEKHPHVKRLKEQIQAKQEELEKENLVYTDNMKLDIKSTAPIVNEIKKALDGLESSANTTADSFKENHISKVMLIDKLDNVMARDVHVNEQVYNMLLQRLETAKITQHLQSSKEGTKYSILDSARVPLKPFQPNIVLMVITGLFLGALVGVGFVIAAEFLDKSFLDVEEAKNYLGIPLLGAISKINTADSIREEKHKSRWMYSLTFVMGVIVVIFSVVLSNFLGQ